MVLGVDFDNTIVRYDDLFHRVAVERGWISATVPANKTEIRNFLRAQGDEQTWTELQGEIYGPRMAEAQPFPGVLDFFARAVKSGIPIHIISHKTRTAVAGPAHDLQQAARDWIAGQGFFDPQRIGLPPACVHFGVTRSEKIAHIRKQGCTHFIDDLEETFREAEFPSGIVKILFGVPRPPADLPDVTTAENWSVVSRYVFPNAN